MKINAVLHTSIRKDQLQDKWSASDNSGSSRKEIPKKIIQKSILITTTAACQ